MIGSNQNGKGRRYFNVPESLSPLLNIGKSDSKQSENEWDDDREGLVKRKVKEVRMTKWKQNISLNESTSNLLTA